MTHIWIVSLCIDGNLSVHPFRFEHEALDKYVKCVKETELIFTQEQIENIIADGSFYDESDGTIIAIDIKEIK
tara:strand:+ start:318 stop:536 length:219 start_codon:yes stop_codon:yes gene_type:complete